MTRPAEDLAMDGAAVVRGFLGPDDAADLRGTVNDIYTFMNSCPRISHRQLRFHFNFWHGVWLGPLPKFLSRTNPDLQRRYTHLLGRIEAQVQHTFGADWRFFPKRSFFRRHIGMVRKVPWHIDADAAAIYRVAGESINVWMPLDQVGTDLPSLEVVPHSHQVMRKVPMLAGKDRYRDDDFVNTIGQTSTPQLKTGDALVFDQFTLHRTQNIGSKDTVRTACEFRFVRHATPTWQGLSGWLRYNVNVVFSPQGYLANKVRSLFKKPGADPKAGP